jgi:hypothetical protein
MPPNTPTPQPAGPAPTPQRPTPAIRDEAPIVSAFKAFRGATDKVGAGLVEAGNTTEEYLQNNLGYETEEPEPTSLPKTPFYTAGHVVDGTLGNIARRANEVVTPVFEKISAWTRLCVHNVLHPVEALNNIKENIVKPAVRIITSPFKMASEIVNAPTRIIDDAAEKSVRNSTVQTNHQVGKIPVLGEAWSWLTNGATRLVAKGTKLLRDGVEWLTSPFTKAHEAAAPA